MNRFIVSRMALVTILFASVGLIIAQQAGCSPVPVFLLDGQSYRERQVVAEFDDKECSEGKGTKRRLQKKAVAQDAEPPKPSAHSNRTLQGWTLRVDNRLLQRPDNGLGTRSLRFLEAKLTDIVAIVPTARLKQLQTVTIVLDLTHGKLRSMQYHPGADWLVQNGYAADLVKCVHIPVAADLPTPRNINEQPWVILHELAHAYHDQVLGFDDPRIIKAFEKFKESGHGDAALLYDGSRVRHYALTDHKEFFAEMTEAYFGVNDFFPFNRAELMTAEPELYTLLQSIWSQGKPAIAPKKIGQGTSSTGLF